MARGTANTQEENMKKLAIAFFTLAFMTMSAFSQATTQPGCSLTESGSPSIRGLRLGMTTQELLALFPGSTKRKETKDALEKAKAATDEAVYLAFDPATDAAKGQFADVGSVVAGLYKGKVMDLGIQYVGPPWGTIDEWVAKLSEAFQLPGAQSWKVGPNEAPNRVLKCNGIEIEAVIQGGGGSVRLRNTDLFKGIEERAKAAEEKKRRDFKPN
jgi:hypothetical protein